MKMKMRKVIKINQACKITSLILFIFFFHINSQTQNINPPAIPKQPVNPNQVANPSVSIPVTPITTPNVTFSKDPNIQKNKKSIDKKEIKEKIDKQKKDEDIFLNFEDASLASVVDFITEQKKVNVIPHRDLEAVKVSLTTRKALTFERAWNILLTLLEMNGFSIIEVGNVYRIVTNKENQQQPLPVYSSAKGEEPEALPDNDTVIRYIYFLKNISADTAASILDSMLEPGSVKVNKDLEACIIKEKSYNIKNAMKIIKKLDTGGSRQSIRLVPLKIVDTETITKIFGEIIGQEEAKGSIRFLPPERKKQASYFSSDVKLIPMTQKNSLILLGKEENLNKIVEFIYKYLDVPIGQADSRIHIKEIQYANAEKLKPILENIIRPPRGQGAEKLMIGEYKFFEDVIIVAETSQDAGEEIRSKGNRLIVACTKEDWVRLEKFINKLDKPQPQIALEVMIVDVQIINNRFLGAQIQDKINKELGKEVGNGVWFQTLNLTEKQDMYTNYIAQNASTSGISSLLTLRNQQHDPSMWGVIKNTFELDNSNIIAQPFLIVNNYQKCSLSDIVNRRLQGKLSIGANAGDNPPETWENVSATTRVDITPYINTNGNVDLKIDITVEDFLEPAEVGTEQPAILNRLLNTRTTMLLGEVLVLGGLTRNRLSDEGTKTPVLGDVPYIGNLFKKKQRNREQKNLYIFIRPSIIKPQIEGGPDEYTQLKLDYAKYQILHNDTYYKEKDPIQRWFFKPTNQKVKAKLADAAKGIFRPIDDYTYGKGQPKSVNIKEDIYYRSSEEIKKLQEQRKLRRRKKSATGSLNNNGNNLKRRNKTFA